MTLLLIKHLIYIDDICSDDIILSVTRAFLYQLFGLEI